MSEKSYCKREITNKSEEEKEPTVGNRDLETLMPTNYCFVFLPYLELLSPGASGIHRTDP
jgi:hypothetical protein